MGGRGEGGRGEKGGGGGGERVKTYSMTALHLSSLLPLHPSSHVLLSASSTLVRICIRPANSWIPLVLFKIYNLRDFVWHEGVSMGGRRGGEGGREGDRRS